MTGSIHKADDAEPFESSTRPSLSAVIERIGFGNAQLLVSLVGGGVWMADGAELLLIGTVSRAVAAEWDLQPVMRGFVVTVVFMGILVGNLMSGSISDGFGRKLPIVMSYFGVCLFSLLSAATTSFVGLCFARFFVGVAFGAGQPAFQSLVTEINPKAWRLTMCGTAFAFFALGEMYSICLIAYQDPYLVDLKWRWLLTLGAIPAGILFFASIFLLQDSPGYLSSQGQHQEARSVLAMMARMNNASDVDVDFEPGRVVQHSTSFAAFQERISIVFSKKLGLSSLIVLYSCFVLNFYFYGCLYAFPQVMADIDFGGTPASQLMVGAGVELVGALFANLFCSMMPRKSAMKAFLGMSVVSLFSFGYAVTEQNGHLLTIITRNVGFWGIKFAAQIGFLVVYQYAAEIYPTEARSTGAALALAGGRAAGMIVPIIFEKVYAETGTFAVFFYIIAVLCMFNAILIDMLPYETADMDDIAEKLSDSSQDNAYGSCALQSKS